MVGWLNKSTVSETSKVGILSSPRLLGLIQPFVEDDIMKQFHRMIYAISLAYTQPHTPDRQHSTTPELLQLGSIAGHKFLRNLDKLLKPQRLRDCSLGQLRALCLLIFGAILAASYTSPQPSGNTQQELAQFKDTQDFLCQILAHYLLYLRSQMKLPIASEMQQFILQAAPARSHRQGLLQWAIAPEVETYNPETTSNRSPQVTSVDQLSENPFALAQGTENINHARPRRGPNHHGYGDYCGSAEYFLQHGEDSGLVYHTQTAKDGSQVLFKVSYREVSVLPTSFSISNSFANCWKCYTRMAPKLGPCIECNGLGIVQMLIPVDAEASPSSTLGGAPTSPKHLLV
jgi:hypothetical protein